MPLINAESLRPIDRKIMEATGIELVPVDENDLVISLNGKDFYLIPLVGE